MNTKIHILDEMGRVVCLARIVYADSFMESGEIYLEPGCPINKIRGMESIHFCVLKSYMDIYQAEIDAVYDDMIEVSYIRNTKKFEARDVKVEFNIPTTLFFEQSGKTFSYDVHMLDISSGGLCISAKKELDTTRDYEVIISMLKDPLILKLKLLRKLDGGKDFIYGCRFQALNDDEEQLLRQMVYKMMAMWNRRKKEVI